MNDPNMNVQKSNSADSTREICQKWYGILGFPSKYDSEFASALDEIAVPDTATIDTYDASESDGRKNLLYYLFFCEELSRRYAEKGISERILLDTLGDIVIWTEIWSSVKGRMYLGELVWLTGHLSMKLFRIGCLEYMPTTSHVDCPELGLRKSDNILDIHIPHGAKITPEGCCHSIDEAHRFFSKHYPEFIYSFGHCHSWLLDPSLKSMLREDSNILNFQRMFHIVNGAENESLAALRYVFTWDTDGDNLADAIPSSRFSAKIKDHVLDGGKLYESVGVIRF